MAMEAKMSEFQQEFEPQLRSFFVHKIADSKTPEEKKIWEEMSDYTLAGGKRIRPFLLWQMLEKKRTEIRGLSDILIAFELLHNSTLIEDDIIDQHTIRRHKPTLPASLHSKNLNGEHISLIAAGLMRCASLNLIISADISDEFKKECVETYTKIATAANEGQTLDLFWTRRLDITESDLLIQAEKVTARFIEYMFRLGVDEVIIKDSWAEIGLHLGIVFQLVDDLLDIDKNRDKGRGVGDDIRLGKTTPLLITTYNNLPTEDKKRFKKNFGNPRINEDELLWIISACETTGASTHVRGLIKERLKKVDSILSSVGIGPDHWIHELNNFFVERIS
ncbi:MAG: polyprenyl synthetase family protein [bacterium]|nr:polyprenyl synthetase family protein [bacterium]